MATDISQLDIFQIVPDPFIRVQVGSIRWQLFHFQPPRTTRCLHLRQEAFDCLVSMNRCSIPDDQHQTLDLQKHILQEAYHSHPLVSSLLHSQQQATLFGYPTDHCQMIPAQWYMQDRCIPTRSIRMHYPGQQIEASLVYPDDSLSSCSRFFLSRGQRLEYQAAM